MPVSGRGAARMSQASRLEGMASSGAIDEEGEVSDEG